MRRIALVFAFSLLLLGISRCEAGSITYDSGSNTIKVVGFSESSPCTFEDIYQADVSNGWGVVSKQGDNQYYFSCTLQIGDGSTETWLIDTNKMIYEDVGMFLYIKGNGHVRFGKVINSEKKITSGGCFIYTKNKNTYMIEMAQNSYIELYSSTLSASDRVFFDTSPNTHAKIWNCNFEHIDFSGNPAQMDIYRLYFVHSLYGLKGIFTSAEDIRLADVDYPTKWFNQHEPVTMKNIVTDKEERYSFSLTSCTANFYIIDTDWKWTGYFSDASAKVYRQYTFNLKVVDENGNPIDGAKVKVYDKSGNLVLENTTDTSGQIPEQIVTRGYYDQAHGSTLVDFSPHTLVIEKEGYETYTMQFTPTEAIDWQVSLKKAEEQETAGEGIIEVKEERKGKSDIGEGLVLGLGFGIVLLAIAFFVIKGGGRE